MLIALAVVLYVGIGAYGYIRDFGYRRTQYGTFRATVNTVCLVLAWPFMFLYAAFVFVWFLTSGRGLF